MGRGWKRARKPSTAPVPYPTGDFSIHETELQPGGHSRDEVSKTEELSGAGNSSGLLRGYLSGAEDEAADSVRETAHHLASLLRHSAVPILRAGRWNQQRSLPNQPGPGGTVDPEPATPIPVWLRRPENLRKLLPRYLLQASKVCFVTEFLVAKS